MGWEDPLEKEMAARSSILAWEIPWTEEPGSYSPWGGKESDRTQRLKNNDCETENIQILKYLRNAYAQIATQKNLFSSYGH